MVKAKQEANGARLDGCEPNPWVLSLLGKRQPGQLGEQGAKHRHAHWGRGAKRVYGEQSWCQSFEGTGQRAGAPGLSWSPSEDLELQQVGQDEVEGLARTDLLPLEMDISLARAWDGLGSMEAYVRDTLLKRLRRRRGKATARLPDATPSGLVSGYQPLQTLLLRSLDIEVCLRLCPHAHSLTLTGFNEDLLDGLLDRSTFPDPRGGSS